MSKYTIHACDASADWRVRAPEHRFPASWTTRLAIEGDAGIPISSAALEESAPTIALIATEEARVASPMQPLPRFRASGRHEHLDDLHRQQLQGMRTVVAVIMREPASACPESPSALHRTQIVSLILWRGAPCVRP